MKKRMLTVFAAALLLTGCGEERDEIGAELIQAPAPAVTEITQAAAQPDSQTAPPEAEINPYEVQMQEMTEQELLNYMHRAESEQPLLNALCPVLTRRYTYVPQRTAATREEANVIAAEHHDNTERIAEEPGMYWVYRGESRALKREEEILILSGDFYDPETQTVCGAVTDERVKLLAAADLYASCGAAALDSGTFLCDDDGIAACTVYYLDYSAGGDWGVPDQVVLKRRRISVDMQTGAVSGLQQSSLDDAELLRADIPGTETEMPDWAE